MSEVKNIEQVELTGDEIELLTELAREYLTDLLLDNVVHFVGNQIRGYMVRETKGIIDKLEKAYNNK